MTETPFVPTPDWVDAICPCPEEDCGLAAYPYVRIKAGGFRVQCLSGHTNSVPLEAISP